MARKVNFIPATLTRYTAEPMNEARVRKVAGYARVSTENDEQQSSYETQMSYYKQFIQSKEGWEYVGMYSDEGISGTSTRQRDGFKRMIEDALEGKIDLIVTKSISRFARNTVDSLVTVRELKQRGVEVFFEKENIWTLDSKGELLITIMSSLAQEESRSISENVIWGQRKKFAEGKSTLAYSRFLGYDADFKINLEEAKVVKLIYKLFLEGESASQIARTLTEAGHKSPIGNSHWHASTIIHMLQNEKYKGDALLQKSYTVDFLQKTKKKNNGEVPQYYVEGHHEAIISPKLFDLVQQKIADGVLDRNCTKKSLFSNKVKCEVCNSYYCPKTWHSNSKYKNVIYRAQRKYAIKGQPCSCPTLKLECIKETFMKALQKLITTKIKAKQELMDNMKLLVDTLCDTESLHKERDRLAIEVSTLENALKIMGSTGSENSLQTVYDDKKARLDKLDELIPTIATRKAILEKALTELNELNYENMEFNVTLWKALLEYISVDPEKGIKVIFLGGIVVKI